MNEKATSTEVGVPTGPDRPPRSSQLPPGRRTNTDGNACVTLLLVSSRFHIARCCTSNTVFILCSSRDDMWPRYVRHDLPGATADLPRAAHRVCWSGRITERQQTDRAAARHGSHDVDYVEAHATGTQIGDKSEGNAIGEVYDGLDRREPLRLASVKSNVGHMEASAFHCSLLKVVLMMQRRTFAPISKNFTVPNPEIDFEGQNRHVRTTCEPFPERPVVVGINSFAFGGANGHCIVREYRPVKPKPAPLGSELRARSPRGTVAEVPTAF